jgi:nucleotidyltransferase AbiEii toxin of type IV toxin-antitoxin system
MPDKSRPYATPGAFRRALTDRLSAIASPYGLWPLPDLQRQFAYDRLLNRLYLLDSGWILKGATALLAREIAVRHTIDIDVYREAPREQTERDLRAAAALDALDWFEFEIGPGTPTAQGATGTRFPVVARIGVSDWARFHIDLLGDAVQMTGTPDDVPPLPRVALPGLDRPGYRAYPIVDHIADKLCAIVDRYGESRRPSTRYKDLLDLVSLITAADIRAQEQLRALNSEAARRSLTLPTQFTVPDPELWERGYAAEAQRAVKPIAATLDEALAIVRPFLEPLLTNNASGTWKPDVGAWT